MFKIALRNILRNKRRSFLTGLSISIAVMVVIYIWSFVSGVMDDFFDNFVRSTSGHIRILNADYLRREKMMPLDRNIANYVEVEKIAEKNPEVTLTAARIKFGVLLNYKDKNKPVLGIGTDPTKEKKISKLDQKIIKGRIIVAGQEEINIGDRLASEMGYKLGDTLTILTQTAYGSIAAMNLKIVGIFRFGVQTFDGQMFYIPLDKAQTMLDLDGKATEIFLLIKNMNNAPKVAAEIKSDIEKAGFKNLIVRPWQDQGIIYLFMRIAKYSYGLIYLIILVLASFTILNTMFMAVLERTKEIGVMKAMGMKNSEIIRLVLFEAMLIGIFASLVGAILGAAIAYYLSVKGVDFSAAFSKMGGELNLPLSLIYRAAFRWIYVFTGFCFGVFFSILAAVPPALRAAKMEPSEALRE